MASRVPPSSYTRVGTSSWAVLANQGNGEVVIASSRVPTFGRSRERAVLEGALDRVASGTPCAVVVRGDTGVGRTRVLEDVARTAADRRYLVCKGTTWQDLQAPFLTLGPQLFPLLAAREGEDGEGTGAPTSPLDDPDRLAGSDEGGAVIASIADDVFALARNRPLLVVVDDAQWADQLSALLLAELVDRIAAGDAAAQLLVVTALRTGDAEGPAPLSDALSQTGVEVVDLGPLAARESVELALASGLRASDRRLAEHLAEGAAGNPLLVTALARQAATQRPGTVDSLFDLPMDGGIAGLLRQQFQDLSTATKNVLAVAALCGPIATPERLARLVGETETAVRASLAEAADAGVIAPGAASPVAFIHPIFRQVAYTATPTISRKLLHVRTAEDLLGDWGGVLPDGVALLAAFHLRRADVLAPRELAMSTCLAAAGVAEREQAWGDAARNLEAVIADTPIGDDPALVGELHLRAGTARLNDLDLDEAAAHAAAALAHFTGDDRGDGGADGRARSLALEHRCEIMRGRLGRLLDDTPLETIVESVEVPAEARVRALIDLSERRWMAGDFAESARLADDAADAARAIDSGELLRAAVVSRATVHWLQYEMSDAHARLSGVVDKAAEEERAPDLCLAAGRTAITSWWLGEPGTAAHLAALADEIADESGQAVERVIPLAVLAARAVHEGDLVLAEQLVDEALSIQRISRDRWGSAFLYPILGGALARHGRGREASGLLNVWTADIDREGGGTEALFADLCKLWVRVWRGMRNARDESYIAEAERIVEVVGGDEAAPMLGVESFLAIHSDIADLCANPSLAAAVIAPLERCGERGMVIAANTGALLVRSRAAAARVAGSLDLATDLVVQAAQVAEGLELPVEQALVRLEAARLDLVKGTDGADAALAAAFEGAELLGLRGVVEAFRFRSGGGSRRSRPAAD